MDDDVDKKHLEGVIAMPSLFVFACGLCKNLGLSVVVEALFTTF